MTRLLPFLLLLLQAGTGWIRLVNGFSVIHQCTKPQLRTIKSQARVLKTRRARPLNHCTLLATSDDEASSSNEEEADKDDSSLESDTDEDKVVEETESASDDQPVTFRERIKKLWWKNDDDSLTTRQRLAKMGLAAVLSYGWVSNVSYAVCVSLAWYGFTKQTGLSPLAPDQWKPFLAVYAGFFVFNNVIRPFRLGLSIAISTYFDQVVAWVQDKTKFNKSISIALVVFFFNIVGTISLMCLGISLASLASGVPIFPGKASLK